MKILGLILIVIGAILLLITRAAENVLIIQMGIRMFSVLSIIPFFIIGIGAIALFFGLSKSIRMRRKALAEIRQKEEEIRSEQMPTLSYSADSYDPIDIRRRLGRLKEQRPDLADLLVRCEQQMDVMDLRQARLKELLDINEAEYLRSTEELLNEVEQFICKNLRKVINRGIVSDAEDDQVIAGDDRYSTYYELIEAVLASNQTELDNIKKFLADLADLVSEQSDYSETTLKAWMKVIRDSLMKEAI